MKTAAGVLCGRPLAGALGTLVASLTLLFGAVAPAGAAGSPSPAPSEHRAAMVDRLTEQGYVGPLCPTSTAHSTSQPGSLAALFEGEQLATVACGPVRYAQAVAQGARMARDAQTDGAQCALALPAGKIIDDWAGSRALGAAGGPGEMWVCGSVDSVWAQRGGTTYGNVFLTPRTLDELRTDPTTPDLLTHEYAHFVQWQLLGARFPGEYANAGVDACTNIFEIAAGLGDGNYQC